MTDQSPEDYLNERRARLDELRQQIAAEEAKAAEAAQYNTLLHQDQELENEEKRLLLQLERAKAETRRIVGESAPEEPPVVQAPAQPGTQVISGSSGSDSSTPPVDPDDLSGDSDSDSDK